MTIQADLQTVAILARELVDKTTNARLNPDDAEAAIALADVIWRETARLAAELELSAAA